MSLNNDSLSFVGASELVEVLKGLGAQRVRHSQRTFLEHLIGTAAILEGWGGSERVCKAGLYHSIYGTEYFGGAILSYDDRPRIKKLLGEDAESLAYIFCAFDRGSIYKAIERGQPYFVVDRATGQPIPVTSEQVQDLIWIIWANAIEQVSPSTISDEMKIGSLRGLAKIARFLPDAAVEELKSFYSLTPGAK